MDYQRVKVEFDGDIALLTFNHPEALNAVSRQMIRDLEQAVREVEEPANGARCLVMTGAGRGFCAGANLNDPEANMGGQGGLDAGEVLGKYYNPLFLQLRDLRMPIITAVNGPAAGVGMSFALMGDLVLAGRSAYFLQAFKRIGLIPDGGATFVLPRLIGWGRAMELSLLAEKLSVEKALEWGLINRIYDDDQLLTEAMNMARELAAGPTKALYLIRQAYWKSIDNSFEQQLQVERIFQREAGKTEDFAEGVLAFREKRPARFKGR
ncbi:MAG: enoyl-CoA hydratase/isomerase [Proteobacteria bacterium]|nr:enoyl-CoA hydratase/isomerase [Pseudomonadota bacterium]